MNKPRSNPSESRRVTARNQRVQEHLSLVNSVASHYAACTQERRDDLRQVAAIGLIRAAERYDSSTQVPFTAFARPHVRGAVLHYLRDVAPLVRVSRRMQERRQQVERCRQALIGREDAVTQERELRQQLGLSERQWADLQAIAHDGRVQLMEPARLEDIQQGWASLDADAGAEDRGTLALSALRRLNRRQRLVVEAVVLQGKSLRAVAERQGSSAATVHRVLHQALAELRRQLNPAFAAPAC